MVIDAALEEWEQRVRASSLSGVAGHHPDRATRHATESSTGTLATAEDYRAVRVARWLWAELSITCWPELFGEGLAQIDTTFHRQIDEQREFDAAWRTAAPDQRGALPAD